MFYIRVNNFDYTLGQMDQFLARRLAYADGRLDAGEGPAC
jgi:hypothetical protein